MVKFINGTDLQFVDISSEKYREYVFNEKVLHFEKPLKLNVSKSGGHRLFFGNGTSCYIAPGWLAIVWEVFDGQPNFVK
jgi:hypothetical protein